MNIFKNLGYPGYRVRQVDNNHVVICRVTTTECPMCHTVHSKVVSCKNMTIEDYNKLAEIAKGINI